MAKRMRILYFLSRFIVICIPNISIQMFASSVPFFVDVVSVIFLMEVVHRGLNRVFSGVCFFQFLFFIFINPSKLLDWF